MDGSYAELVAVPEVNAYKLGGDVSFADAAAIPTTYLPVWNMAVRRAELQPWETALVFSASAGVGAAAIQVFKNVVGATVITTTSTPEKAELARVSARTTSQLQRGRHHQRGRENHGGRVDGGGTMWARTSGPTGSGTAAGRTVRRICGATSESAHGIAPGLLSARQIEVYAATMGTREDMRQIVASLNRGVINPAIHRTYPLADAADAHRDMEATNFFGKLILTP